MNVAAILEDVTADRHEGGVDVQESVTYWIEYGTAEYDASIEWARFHGLDPCRIPAGSLITRNQFDHTIRYVEIVLDRADGVCTRPCVERGEAGPMPFPEIITKEGK